MGVACIAFVGTSLDGFIAKPDGNIDWLNDPKYDIPGEDFGFKEHFQNIDAMVMGRKTYELLLTFDEWYYEDKHIYVLSTGNPKIPDHLANQVSTVSGDLNAILRDIENNGHHHLYIDGGKTIQSFLRENLLDEITVTRLPILLGSGITLFGELPKDVHLEHLDTRIYENGLVKSKYAVERNS